MHDVCCCLLCAWRIHQHCITFAPYCYDVCWHIAPCTAATLHLRSHSLVLTPAAAAGGGGGGGYGGGGGGYGRDRAYGGGGDRRGGYGDRYGGDRDRGYDYRWVRPCWHMQFANCVQKT
jgi:hypothetical protein